MMSIDDEAARHRPCPGGAGPPHPPGISLRKVERQRIWLHLQSRAWRTLAVVPAEEGMPADEVARSLAAITAEHGESIVVVDAREFGLGRVAADIEAATLDARGGRVIFVARSVEEDLATIPLAQAVDAVVLCVSIGSTSLRAIEETIASIGKERFLASLSIRARPREVPAVPWMSWLAAVATAKWRARRIAPGAEESVP